MPPTSIDPDITEGDDKRGLSRRTMIKRAAAAGAIAWTAPVILDSLSSPAAAVSVPAGCYGYVFFLSASGSTCTVTLVSGGNNGGNNCSKITIPASGTCSTYTDALGTPEAAVVTAAGCTALAGSLTGFPTFSIVGGYSCTFLQVGKNATCATTGASFSAASGTTATPSGTPSSASYYALVGIKCG